MKKTIVVLLALGLIVGAVQSTAVAKKKKKPKPVATTLYLHGAERLGEVENGGYFADAAQGGGQKYMGMDQTAPTGSDSKSMFMTTYGVGPNVDCAGNVLFPVWAGKTIGTIKGDMKLTFFTTSSPGEVDVRVWPDIVASTCNADYPAPAREVRVPVAQNGKVEAVLKGKDFKAQALLMVQVSPAWTDVNGTHRPFPPFLGRIFYDSKDQASALSFSCLPAGKAKTCS